MCGLGPPLEDFARQHDFFFVQYQGHHGVKLSGKWEKSWDKIS
jgi:hypothetical protein